ncbi:HalOD1 output domain-containing protein [Haloarcula onubensis]|uniref:Halobacterial output domain-containing protein n=1 Tax=Haloarcula onubensis TaxID=2950539 RepID=A0ABU2FSY1_9EURY|nr:HalOD1 output domain-containing protein [Halomicroarcula sp. S3CR25-11]MDS0283855.1 hypothetical protein [Halomicroarcula sp. S3CR25-11]
MSKENLQDQNENFENHRAPGESFLMSGRKGPSDHITISDFADTEPKYQARFVGRPSKAVIEAMVTLQGADLADLPVAYSIIDLDALDNLFQNPMNMDFPGEISFCLGEYRFFLSSDGSVDVYDLSDLHDSKDSVIDDEESERE